MKLDSSCDSMELKYGRGGVAAASRGGVAAADRGGVAAASLEDSQSTTAKLLLELRGRGECYVRTW